MLGKDVIDTTDQSSTGAQQPGRTTIISAGLTPITVRPAEDDHELVSAGREPGATSVIVRDHIPQG